jgi:hypothetical protein
LVIPPFFLVNRFGYKVEIIGYIYLFNLFIKKPEELVLIYGTYPSGFCPKSVTFINKCFIPLGPDFFKKNGTLGTLPL